MARQQQPNHRAITTQDQQQQEDKRQLSELQGQLELAQVESAERNAWKQKATDLERKLEDAHQAAAAETATSQRRYAAAQKDSQLLNDRIMGLMQKHDDHHAHAETLQCLLERTAMENEDSRSRCIEQQSFIITCSNMQQKLAVEIKDWAYRIVGYETTAAARDTLIRDLEMQVTELQTEVNQQRTATKQAMEAAEFAVRRIVRIEAQASVSAVRQKRTPAKPTLEEKATKDAEYEASRKKEAAVEHARKYAPISCALWSSSETAARNQLKQQLTTTIEGFEALKCHRNPGAEVQWQREWDCSTTEIRHLLEKVRPVKDTGECHLISAASELRDSLENAGGGWIHQSFNALFISTSNRQQTASTVQALPILNHCINQFRLMRETIQQINPEWHCGMGKQTET